MKKLLLLGYYGHSNLGDELLYNEALSVIPKDYKIYILSNKGVKLSENKREVVRLNNKKELLSHYYDLVLVMGGGVFPQRSFSVKLALFYLILSLFSKRFVCSGIGIVPKDGFLSNLFFKLFLESVSYISVRDKVSLEYVNSLLKNGKVVCAYDRYFGRDINADINSFNQRNGLLVCLANPFSEEEKQNSRILSRYYRLLKSVQDIIYHMASQCHTKTITFVPFYMGSDDLFINDILKDKRLKDSKVLQLNHDYNFDSIDALFSQFEVGLCMRYHSFVLAIRNCLPFVGICYDYKSESLLDEIGLSKVGVRYGIRKSDFFGIEKDLEEEELYNVYEYIGTNYKSIQNLMEVKRNALHKAVVDDYKKIFENK